MRRDRMAWLEKLGWPLLVLVAAAAMAAPLWSSQFLPFQDAPEHVAAIRVLADYHARGLGFDRFFTIDLERLQYLAFYLPAAWLAKAIGAQAACRVMLTLVIIGLPASLWMLLGAFGHDRRLALFAPIVFHSTTAYLGFFNFLESIPFAIAVVALTERELRGPRRGRAIVLALLSVVLIWMHPSALAFALGAGVLLAITSTEERRRKLRALLPLVPAALVFCAWAVSALAARGGGGMPKHGAPQWQPFAYQLYDLVRFGNVLFSHADEVFWVVIVALWAALTVMPGQKWERRAWRLPMLAALALAGYFALPLHMGFMGYIATRAVPFFVLLSLAVPHGSRRPVTSVLLVLAVAAQAVYGAKLARSYRAFDEEAEATNLWHVLDAAKPGERLVGTIWVRDSAIFQFKSYLHFAQYYEVERGGRARVNFAETPWTPIRFRTDDAPVPLPFGWENHPELFDPTYEGAETDYVLVRGGIPPRGNFVLRSSAGSWSLYQRQSLAQSRELPGRAERSAAESKQQNVGASVGDVSHPLVATPLHAFRIGRKAPLTR